MTSSEIQRHTQHMLTVLKAAIRVLGFSYNDVAQKLGLSSGYLSRLFAGKIELRFEHIVAIAQVLGFEPEEIFQLAYPRQAEPPSKAAQRYRALTAGAELPAAGLPPPPAAASPWEREVERLMTTALHKVLAPPPPPELAPPTGKDLEELMERTLRKLLGNLAQSKAE